LRRKLTELHALCQALCGPDDLIARAIVERNYELEAFIFAGKVLSFAEHCDEIGRHSVLRTDDPEPNVVFMKLGEVAADEAPEKPHEIGNLDLRPLPILRRKAEEGKMGDADVRRRAHAFFCTFNASAMALRAREPPLCGPAAITVHDYGNMFRTGTLFPKRNGAFL
jgi:hypothetical protein